MQRFSPNPNQAHLIDWFEWEDEAFQRAREQDKPVLLFLSAFWCRYCQRMDEGAFSERENLALLNAYFIVLRIENAKRPDIDARYNLNGWPTMAFFTPAGELLAAANFLPAEEFKELLLNVYLGYRAKSVDERLHRAAIGSETASAAAPDEARLATLKRIDDAIMALADKTHGGYGRGQKFIQSEANEFLLARYQATKDRRFLDHVCLTLERMRAGPIYDGQAGGYFRTTTGADWSQPHREKLLAEHAGLLVNCLRLFQLTGRGQYARMGEEIISYLDGKLFDSTKPAYFGCEDFLRYEAGAGGPRGAEFFSIIDNCVYVDANAQAVVAYLDAAELLARPDCQARALSVLEFLWQHCRSDSGAMFHYFEGAPHLPGLLQDQAQTGMALIKAYTASGEGKYLDRARQLAQFVIDSLRNPRGGYFDLPAAASDIRRAPLTDIAQNGVAASFFLKLSQAANQAVFREQADWALRGFGGDVAAYGIHAAPFGQALSEFLGG